MISVSDLSYSIGSAQILRDVSLTIPKGGITALIGPNGAGKSTLLSLIARLNPIQTGRICVNDLVVGDCPSSELAQRLAILPQRAHISARLTVRELIQFGRYPHSRGRLTAQDHAHVDRAIAVLELTELQHRQIETLSGGQKQRAHLAMIYAQNTDYMLLDEPLNNLDIAASRRLMALLTTLAQDHGRTIVIVLHDINFASAYAAHLVAMAGGRVVANGPPADLINAEFMQTVFNTRAEVAMVNGRCVVLP